MDQSNHEHSLHQQSSFDSHKHKASVIEVFPDEENSYPVCLNTKHPDAYTTPLSRLSGVTKESEIKKYEDSENTITSPTSNKVVSKLDIESVEDNLKVEVKRLTDLLADLKCKTVILEKRNEEIAIALEKEKLKNNHLEAALNIIKKDDRQLDKKLHEKENISTKLKQELENEKNLKENQNKKLEQYLAENNYLKELIIIANNNYQNLENKFKIITEKNKLIEKENSNKSKEFALSIHEMKNALTDLITLPNYHSNTNHCLSFGEQDENCLKKNTLLSTNRNSKKQTEEIYRKMFMKTLRGTK